MSKAVRQRGLWPALAAPPGGRAAAVADTVRLLEVEPELGAGIAPEQRPAAVGRAVALVLPFDRGPWRFRPRDNGGLGAIILDGMILVRVEFAGIRAHVEVLAEGDVISPWYGVGRQATAPCAVTARVVSNLRSALLDRAFMERTATAITRLRDQGKVDLIARHQWLLRGDPPARLAGASGDGTDL